MKYTPILIGTWLDGCAAPDPKSPARAIFTLVAAPGRWLHTRPKQKHRRTFSRCAAILLALGLPLSSPLSAYASPPDDPVEEQFLAQRKKIDLNIVAPCKAERRQKAAQIQTSIEGCGCPPAEKQEHTAELATTLQNELQKCEKKGADALDQYKRAVVSQAQDDFIRFKELVEVDRQILHNFGFSQTVDEMESWAQFSENAQKEYARRAQEEVKGKFFQSIHLKAEAMAATPRITSQKAISLYNLFKATGVKDKALFDALAAAGRGESKIPERMLWEEITKSLEHLNEAREVVQTEPQALDIFNSMLDVAGWLAPDLAPELSIVKDATWIGYATYTHAEVAHGLHDVNRLTTLTEAQLKDLEPVTRRLKQDVDGLVRAKKVLQWAAESGNNTSLAR